MTIEGPDGSGKSIQSERLGARLQAAGIPCLVTREPGGTALGEAVREILLHALELAPTPAADALLFNAARAQHVAEVVRPALARGEVVVSDRFGDSTLAYQGYGGGEPLEALRALVAFATGGLRPDLTVLIDVPVEAGLQRKLDDERVEEITRFETARDVAFHERVRGGFLELAAAEPERWIRVDGRGGLDEVEREILEAVRPRLPESARQALGGTGSSEPAASATRRDL